MKKNLFRGVSAAAAGLTLAALLSACSGEPTQPVSVKLVVSPAQLMLSDSVTSAALYLTADATGGRLEWELTESPTWLTVTPTTGTIQDKPVKLTVSAPGLATMEPGWEQGALDFVSNGGTARVVVTASVAAHPLVTFSAASLTIPGTSDTARITLNNTGRGPLAWSASLNLASLKVVPASGTLQTGQDTVLAVIADKGPLPVGTTSATLTLQSNSKQGNVTLPVSVVVTATPRADVPVGRLVFGSGVTTRDFYVRNLGKGPLNWSVAADMAWLTFSPSSGQTAAGDSMKVRATADKSGLSGDALATMTLSADGTVPHISLPVLVTSAAPFPLGLTVLDHRVVDAEYSAVAGLIVTVSANPSQLNMLDLETGKVTHVSLSLPPTCVSVRPDGAFAAVGHDGYITYVNLGTQFVVKTYAITISVLDLVLASNGWMYAMPLRDQWADIHGIELATGQEKLTGGIYAGARARLHPSGNYLYVPWNGLSPDNVDKYDIRNGIATPLWHSPYWGDYSFGGNIWFSEDGARMFARSGNVFRASDAQNQDMYYAGSLVGAGWLRWAADSRTRGRVYVLGDGSPTALRLYDTAYLAFLGTTALPTFDSPGGPVNATGYYVFPSAAGDRLYVLQQADPSAGLASDWGVAVLDATTLP